MRYLVTAIVICNGRPIDGTYHHSYTHDESRSKLIEGFGATVMRSIDLARERGWHMQDSAMSVRVELRNVP